VWTVRPPNARAVDSKNPPSLSVSVWIASCTSNPSQTSIAVRMFAGVAPQSSWIFRPAAPATICSDSASGSAPEPLPRKPVFTGIPSAARSMNCTPSGPGVQVVPRVPSAVPVPPPKKVVMPPARPCSACCGEM
jgi:hypothetical protein